MLDHSRSDLLLALISILSVVFVILFISLAYFLNFRTDLDRREAYIDGILHEIQMMDAQRGVAGYHVSE